MKSGSTQQPIQWHIISRRLNDEPLSAEEESQFNRWISASKEHRAYYEKASLAHDFSINEPPENDLYHKFDALGISGNGSATRRKINLRTYMSVAAAFAMALVTAATILFVRQKQETTVVEESHATGQSIHPATSRACLILPDGNTVAINAGTHRTLSADSLGGSLRISDGNVTCEALLGNVYTVESSTTIAVPRGGIYGLTLSDGTKVWLNANTCLRFPTTFNGDTRLVELDGEAYFEVTEDKSKPFIVSTSLSDIRVYGTKFNVRSYTRDHSQQTTLVSGSIGVTYAGKNRMLNPGQQARIVAGSDNIRIYDVDPEQSCAWVDGQFVFENMALQEILTQLSDWYDVDFVYTEPSLRHLHFTGDLERYADFSEILSLIELTTSVRFKIEERTVKVLPK